MKRLVIILALAGSAHAQIPAPLDVTTSVPIRDENGLILAGNNPVADPQIPGALVQIIKVGLNGVADLPNPDGSPGGDDTLAATTVIGQGIAPEIAQSGRFSTSFYPPPTGKIYARVWNGGYYGQSATFTPHNSDVFDLSALGLSATTQALGQENVDTDGDGMTNYQELIANTNPLNASDHFDVARFALNGEVEVAARAGRQYTLQRSTGDLNSWSDLSVAGPFAADQTLLLQDPSPPNTNQLYYRVKVTMP